jgi:stearoyl-CoA desaturase (delta-9 desaturase)
MTMTPEPTPSPPAPAATGWRATLGRWFDSDQGAATRGEPQAIDWGRIVPYLLLHLSCIAVVWVGWSWTAVITAAALYLVRMFAITGFYHRYFSHRTFKTSRVGQFLFGVLGASAVQRGPVWWAAHHRHHHAHSDQPGDVHSPVQRGFLMSHTGWFLTGDGFRPDLSRVQDLLRYPELRWLDRYDIAVPALLAIGLFGLGVLLEYQWPELGTDGWQMLVWGFSISTVVCYHATYTINSLSHVFGRRRYDTGDASRNNFWLALLTLGEGWHNNHHFYPSAARQGFYWWEIDLTWYGLKMLSWTGLIWDLKPVPVAIRDRSPRRLDR